MIELALKGMKDDEIAKTLDIARRTVGEYRRGAGIASHIGMKDDVIKLIDEGLTDYEIAQLTGLMYLTVGAYRRQAGIVRSRGGHKVGEARKLTKSSRKGNTIHLTVTKEAKSLGWTPRDGIKVIIDRDNERLILKRVHNRSGNAKVRAV